MPSRQAKRVSRQPNLMPARASDWVAAGVDLPASPALARMARTAHRSAALDGCGGPRSGGQVVQTWHAEATPEHKGEPPLDGPSLPRDKPPLGGVLGVGDGVPGAKRKRGYPGYEGARSESKTRNTPRRVFARAEAG